MGYNIYNEVKVAGIVQLVEHLLAKEDVARSSRVTRSLKKPALEKIDFIILVCYDSYKWVLVVKRS